MSMFMISPFKRLFCSGIKKTSYRNNFLDLEKYSLKQSFNFKKRVGESHVLQHNMVVELFKGKHKMDFEWGSGHYFSPKNVQVFFAEKCASKSKNFSSP